MYNGGFLCNGDQDMFQNTLYIQIIVLILKLKYQKLHYCLLKLDVLFVFSFYLVLTNYFKGKKKFHR